MTALLHKLVSDTFMTRMYSGAMEAGVKHIFFPVQDDGLKDSPSARARAGAARRLGQATSRRTMTPSGTGSPALDDASRMALLAHCVSYGVNALYERPNPHSAGGVSQHTLDMRLAQADRLTRATGLDHGRGRLAPDLRQLPQPGHQAPHPRRRSARAPASGPRSSSTI